jgi:hypothetical protein
LTFVLDTSVSMAWRFSEELDEYAQAVLDGLGNDQALVSQLWPLETANVLVLSERKRRLTSALPIIVDTHLRPSDCVHPKRRTPIWTDGL